MVTIALQDVLPGRVDCHQSVLDRFTRDETGRRGRPPRAVLRATSLDDVVVCMRWARETMTPVIPLGAGTSLEGHLLARGDEVMLDLTAMTSIKRVSSFDFCAVVEPGVTRKQLSKAVAREGLQFTVDPGADATLGGMAATNASGTTTLRYGGMRPNVAALQVVFADGSVRRLGRPVAKTSSGYDLKDLLIGSAGTLGIITELTVRLQPIPEATCAVRLSFPDVVRSVEAAIDMIASCIPVSRLELVDGSSVAALNRYRRTSHQEQPSLFVDVEAPSVGLIDDVIESVSRVARDHEVVTVTAARTASERNALWDERHNLYFAIKAAHPGHQFLTTDTAVPYSQIAATVDAAYATAAELGVEVTLAGHIGDGNVHVVVPYCPSTYERAQRFGDRMVAHALSVGGTATGEHGIGLSKKHYLEAEHGGGHDLMRTIKYALDPLNLLNPGKVVDPAA